MISDKMKIKTTEEISVEDYTKMANKKRVAVDDIIKYLDNEYKEILEDLHSSIKTQ